MRTHAVHRRSQGKSRWPEAHRSNKSATATDIFMDNACECHYTSQNASTPFAPSVYSLAMPVSPTSLRSVFPEQTSRSKLTGSVQICVLLGGFLIGAANLAWAQVPGRGASPSGLVGASMAVLATLQDANVLPPEDTPEANHVIKAVIQFQSVFLKSSDPVVQLLLTRALAAQGGGSGEETLSQFRSTGWTSDVLEALSAQWIAMGIDQRDRLAPGFRQFNVSPADFDRFMELVSKARTTFIQREQTIHQVFAQRRREMPGSTP